MFLQICDGFKFGKGLEFKLTWRPFNSGINMQYI